MPKSACLIFNPVAGSGDGDRALNQIKTAFEGHIELDIRETTPEVEAGQLAKEAIEREVEAIIVSGGDGTVSAVADAVIGTGIPLGIISRGTANALANALEIPSNIVAACETILDGETKTIDTASCGGLAEGEALRDRPMVLLTGIGFEAETVDNADREKKNRFGVFAYILSGFQQLQNWEEFSARIKTDKGEYNFQAAAITVANAAPPTSVLAQGTEAVIPDDGLLDITIISPQNNFESLAASYHLYTSALQNQEAQHETVTSFRTKEIEISTDPPQKIVIDGEVIGEKSSLNITCQPNSLTVYIPKTEINPAPPQKIQVPNSI